MIKVALLGYGRMGQTINKLAKNNNLKIHAIFDSSDDWEKNEKKLEEVDVAIDFSHPSAAYNNIRKCFKYNVPIVSGTTGWLEKIDEVKKLISDQKQTFLYGSNFSIGMQVFFKINKKLAQLIQPDWNYDCSIKEIHHIHKLDAPSGTALSLAEQVIDYQKYNKWSLEEKSEEILPIEAVREGEVKGHHIVTYENDIDIISISHEAKSRDGFALGAILCAKWLVGKKGYFTVEDYLDDLLKQLAS